MFTIEMLIKARCNDEESKINSEESKKANVRNRWPFVHGDLIPSGQEVVFNH